MLRARRLHVAIVALVAAVFASQTDAAERVGSFGKLLGNWRGSGQVVGRNGSADRIACRASYSSSGGGDAMSQSLTCASDSYRFDIRSFFVNGSDGVRGHWDELSRNVSGQVSGNLADGQFSGSIVGPGFTAAISLKTVGRRQTVTISPQEGDIAEVNIQMARKAEF
jgi:hypothetical protein